MILFPICGALIKRNRFFTNASRLTGLSTGDVNPVCDNLTDGCEIYVKSQVNKIIRLIKVSSRCYMLLEPPKKTSCAIRLQFLFYSVIIRRFRSNTFGRLDLYTP